MNCVKCGEKIYKFDYQKIAHYFNCYNNKLPIIYGIKKDFEYEYLVNKYEPVYIGFRKWGLLKKLK